MKHGVEDAWKGMVENRELTSAVIIVILAICRYFLAFLRQR